MWSYLIFNVFKSFPTFLQIFTELTNFEPVVGELSFAEKRDVDQLESLPELAYRGLWLLCSSDHSEGNEPSSALATLQCLRRVFQRLLYVVLLMRKEERAKPCLLPCTHAAGPGRALHQSSCR